MTNVKLHAWDSRMGRKSQGRNYVDEITRVSVRLGRYHRTNYVSEITRVKLEDATIVDANYIGVITRVELHGRNYRDVITSPKLHPRSPLARTLLGYLFTCPD